MFVLERKGKKVCVVEAKMEDFEQGLAQNLLGWDAVADVENVDVVYGTILIGFLFEAAIVEYFETTVA